MYVWVRKSLAQSLTYSPLKVLQKSIFTEIRLRKKKILNVLAEKTDELLGTKDDTPKEYLQATINGS